MLFRSVRDEWGELIEDYLINRPNLSGIIQIVDARHKPTADDKMMVNWLKEMGYPALIAATKADKISRNQRKKREKIIKESLDIGSEMDFCFFSAKTGEGKNRVFSFMLEQTSS